MNSFLLNRQLGSISHQALAVAQNERLLAALQIAPQEKFFWEEASQPADEHDARVRSEHDRKAHVAGLNSFTIDRFEGR